MARAGDVIENPVTGERIIFRKTAADTNGELLQFELFFKPRALVPFEHVHPHQEERVQVVAGTVRFRLGGKEDGLAAGESVVLPAGIPHTLCNAGDDEAHLLVEARPGMKLETTLETIFGLARDGKVNEKGLPNLLQGAVLARESQTFLARPPVALQRAVLAVLAPIARLRGYRARYPRYSGPE